MSIKDLKLFLHKSGTDSQLREKIQACSTADDVAQIAKELGYEFSGDELLRISGNKVGTVTVKKNDIPGEYS